MTDKPDYSHVAQSILDLPTILSQPAPPIHWAVPGIIAEEDITFISGIGGIGKSYVMLSLAISLASGKPLFSHFPITRQYNVAYIDMEMAEMETRRRVARMLKGMEFTPQNVPPNLHVGVRGTLLLDSLDSTKQLAAFIKHHKLDFICIDPYRRVYMGDDKGSDTSNRVFKILSALRNEHRVGFMFVAHWRKRSQEDALNDPKERLMGTADQRNMIDCHISVQPGGEEDTLKIEPDKGRHGDSAQEDFRVAFQHDDAFDPDGPFRLVYLAPTSGKREQTILAELTKQDGQWISYTQLATSSTLHPKAIQRGAARLIAAQLVERKKVGKEWCLKATGQQANDSASQLDN